MHSRSPEVSALTRILRGWTSCCSGATVWVSMWSRLVVFVVLLVALVVAGHAFAASGTPDTGQNVRTCVSNPILLNAGRALHIKRTWGALVLCVSQPKSAALAARMFANAACRWEAKTAGLGMSPDGTMPAYGRAENFHAAMKECRLFKANAAVRSLRHAQVNAPKACFAHPPEEANAWKESWPTFEIYLVREGC